MSPSTSSTSASPPSGDHGGLGRIGRETHPAVDETLLLHGRRGSGPEPALRPARRRPSRPRHGGVSPHQGQRTNCAVDVSRPRRPPLSRGAAGVPRSRRPQLSRRVAAFLGHEAAGFAPPPGGSVARPSRQPPDCVPVAPWAAVHTARFAVVAVLLVAGGCASDDGKTPSHSPSSTERTDEHERRAQTTTVPATTTTVATTTTTEAPVDLAAPPPPARARQRPRGAGRPDRGGGDDLEARRGNRGMDLAQAALVQQVAYRQLGDHPQWDAAVLAEVPAELHHAVRRHVAARREAPSAHHPPSAADAGVEDRRAGSA